MMRGWIWLLAFGVTPSMADPSPVSAAFQVQATVAQGCVFGTSAASAVSDFGIIDFGSIAAFSTGQDAVSSPGNGSIVLTCTPGMSVTIGLGSGLNSVVANQRLLKRVGGTEVLPYELYQDVARTTVWGTGAQGRAISNFPLTTQTYTVFARLLSRNGWPRAGEYVDRVVVELTY